MFVIKNTLIDLMFLKESNHAHWLKRNMETCLPWPDFVLWPHIHNILSDISGTWVVSNSTKDDHPPSQQSTSSTSAAPGAEICLPSETPSLHYATAHSIP